MPLLQADYQIRLYNPTTGLQVAVLTDWRTFFLERTLNGIDTLTLSLQADDPNIEYFVLDAIIEVWRRLPRSGSEWYIETVLLHRTDRNDLESNGRRIFTSYSRGLNDLLHRRHILYAAKTAYVLKSGPGETVMKEFVDQNAGPGSANADRKDDWNPIIDGLTIEGNEARGAVWAGSVPWKNLLDVLNTISLKSGVDFSVERTGVRLFQFRTYYPQYGTNRQYTTIFAPEYANMTNIVITKSRTEEANSVVALGQGEETARVLWPQGDTSAQAASPWNTIEFTRDARNDPTLTELQTTAQAALNELKAQNNFTFDVIQTSERMYGQDGEYWFGDIVRAQYGDVGTARKIVGVRFTVENGEEQIDFTLSEYPVRSE